MKGLASLKNASLGAIKFRYLELPDTFFARVRGTVRVDDDLICAALVAHAGMDIARGKPQPIPLVKKESIVIFASHWPGQVNQEVRDRALLPYEPRRPKPRIAKFAHRAMNANP